MLFSPLALDSLSITVHISASTSQENFLVSKTEMSDSSPYLGSVI